MQLTTEPEIVFKAMADGTRQRTLTVLAQHELSVSELVEILHQPQSTVSRHLRVLREAGLIHDRRDGNMVLYSLPTNGSSTNGHEGSLSDDLLSWVARQPMSAILASRLESVLQRRKELSDKFFGRVGREWDELREQSFGCQFHLEAFLALLPRTWTVADVGTGTGSLLPTLARHFQQVIGVDPVEAMLDIARHRISQAGCNNVELHQGDLSKLPLPSDTIDLLVAALVLHHVPSPQDAIAQLFRVAREGGRVLIIEQGPHQETSFYERMQDHWWGFESDKLCQQLRQVGFKEVIAHALTTVVRAKDAPELFVITATKGSLRDKGSLC